MTSYMNMMFEVEDLAVASPATVSRAGMVYMEPEKVVGEPLAQSWWLITLHGVDARRTARSARASCSTRRASPDGSLHAQANQGVPTAGGVDATWCATLDPRHCSGRRRSFRSTACTSVARGGVEGAADQVPREVRLRSSPHLVGRRQRRTSSRAQVRRVPARAARSLSRRNMGLPDAEGRSSTTPSSTRAPTGWVHWDGDARAPFKLRRRTSPFFDILVPTDRLGALRCSCSSRWSSHDASVPRALRRRRRAPASRCSCRTSSMNGMQMPSRRIVPRSASRRRRPPTRRRTCSTRSSTSGARTSARPAGGQEASSSSSTTSTCPQREKYGAQPPIEILRQAGPRRLVRPQGDGVLQDHRHRRSSAAMGPPGGGRRS